MANERVLNIFPPNHLQAQHWARIDYNIISLWLHNSSVSEKWLLPQQQRWWCYLVSHTGLEMATDDRFFSGDHTFALSFNDVMSRLVIFVYFQWKVRFLQGAKRIDIVLCRYHGCLYLEINRTCCGSDHASSPIWLGYIYISGGLVEFLQGVMCCIVNAGTCFEIVTHGQL